MTAPPRPGLTWILVLLLTVFAVAPLTYPGFFQAHTGFLPVFRVIHLGQPEAAAFASPADSLRSDGILPYALIWPVFRLSGSGIAAIKWGYGLAFVLGALGVYAWSRRRLGSKGALLAAAVYTYLPWHLSTVYVRGAYAEAWLWAFWPFILWAVDRPPDRRLLTGTVLVGALAACGLTQVGLSGMFVLGLAVIVNLRRHTSAGQRLASVLAMALVLVIELSSAAARIPFADHFLYPYQLLSAAWGWGPSVAGWADDMSFQLGIAAVALGVLAPVLVSAGHREQAGAAVSPDEPGAGPARSLRRAVWLATAAVLIIALLTLPPAAPLWRLSGAQGLLTYPWQILALTGLPLAFLAGSVVRLEPRLSELPALAGLTALVVLASYSTLAPRFTRIDPGLAPVAILQPAESTVPQILLLETAIDSPSEITPTLTLTLTWQAVEPVIGNYSVFVHLLAPDGSKVAQRDSRPCGGACPTNTWSPGQIVLDRYELTVPQGAPAGPFRLALGLYLLEGGQRAEVLGRDDRTVIVNVP